MKKLIGSLVALSAIAIVTPAHAMTWTQTAVSEKRIFVPDVSGDEPVYDTVTSTEYQDKQVTEQVSRVSTESETVQVFGNWTLIGKVAIPSAVANASIANAPKQRSVFLSDSSAGSSKLSLNGLKLRELFKADQAIVSEAKPLKDQKGQGSITGARALAAGTASRGDKQVDRPVFTFAAPGKQRSLEIETDRNGQIKRASLIEFDRKGQEKKREFSLEGKGNSDCNLYLSQVNGKWILKGNVGSGKDSVTIDNWTNR